MRFRTEPVNIDETSWRENCRRRWLWTVAGSSATLFRTAASRRADVAKSLLGSAFPHVATCDRYAGYLWIGRVQLCWAQLRRDFQAMIDRGADGRPVGDALLSHAEVLFDWWHRVRDGTPARSKRIVPGRQERRRIALRPQGPVLQYSIGWTPICANRNEATGHQFQSRRRVG